MACKDRYATESNIRTLVELIKIEFGQYFTSDEVLSEINKAVSGISSISFKKVSVLPEKGETNVIYLVPHVGSEKDSYDEYIWIEEDSSYELLGTLDTDLSIATEEDIENGYDINIKPYLNKTVNIVVGDAHE